MFCIELCIRVPQSVLFIFQKPWRRCPYFHDVKNVTISPANNETHTLSTAVNLIDKGANKLKNIPE